MDDASRASLIVAELASAGIATHSVIPIHDCRDSAGYRAETTVGSLVVKLRPEAQPLRASARAAELLAHAPMDHQEVVLAPKATAAGWLIALRWMGGHALSAEVASPWDRATGTRFGLDLGRWLRRLHALTVPQLDWGAQADVRLDAKLAASVDRRCVDERTADHVRRCWALARPHLDGAPTALVHRDLHRSNILEDGGRFAGVIDFEQSLLADPLYDIAKLLDSVLPLHPSIDAGFRTGYALDADAVAPRLWASLVLERLSSMPYFSDLGDETQLDFHRVRLEGLLVAPLRAPDVVVGGRQAAE